MCLCTIAKNLDLVQDKEIKITNFVQIKNLKKDRDYRDVPDVSFFTSADADF